LVLETVFVGSAVTVLIVVTVPVGTGLHDRAPQLQMLPNWLVSVSARDQIRTSSRIPSKPYLWLVPLAPKCHAPPAANVVAAMLPVLMVGPLQVGSFP
jgi:hypothetical protein